MCDLSFYFSTYLLECLDALVKMLTLVSCANLYADASLTLWHYGVVEAGNEDTFLLHLGSILLTLGSVVDHNGADGTF